jgi:hypothetical protein
METYKWTTFSCELTSVCVIQTPKFLFTLSLSSAFWCTTTILPKISTVYHSVKIRNQLVLAMSYFI